MIDFVPRHLPAERFHDPLPPAKTSSPRFPKHGRVPSAVSFLFPLYLLGAAAIAVPILLHLRRRPPKEHMEFSSLMFLAKSPERVTRRTRLEHLLLLALRCLAILLLAFAFGRPFLASVKLPSEETRLTRAVVLIDRSASMQRDGLREASLVTAREALSRYASSDEVAIGFFDEELHLAADLPALAGLGTGARVAAFDKLAAEEPALPGWRGTDLGGAMVQAANLLLGADTAVPADHREVVIISDFQEGAKRDRLNENPWSADVSVRCLPLSVEKPGNLSLALAATPPRSNIDEAEVHRVRITNSADADSPKATLAWKGFPDSAVETLVAPGTGRILSTPPRPPGAERGTLVLTGDTHPFDNKVHVSPVQPRPLRILFLGSESDAASAGSPLFYLRRALQPTPALTPLVTTTEILTAAGLAEHEVVVVSDAWEPGTGSELRGFAEKGGLVLALPSDATSSDAFAALTGQPDWKLSEAAVKDYALLANLDFEHPVLQPFARAGIRDFTKIRFWKHRLLAMTPSGTSRVVATFDDQSPAILEHRIGEGAVFAFLAGWRPEESQLALSSKFVPLLYSIFDRAGYSIRSAPTLYVGETVYQKPGFYEEDKGGQKLLVAVNLDPAEGRTFAFDPAVDFASLGIPLLDAAAPVIGPELSGSEKIRVEAEQKEEKQKLWKWLILAALLVLIIETWLAGRRSAPGSRFKVSGSKLEPQPNS
jgi:hypothetical protein